MTITFEPTFVFIFVVVLFALIVGFAFGLSYATKKILPLMNDSLVLTENLLKFIKSTITTKE